MVIIDGSLLVTGDAWDRVRRAGYEVGRWAVAQDS